MEDNDNELSKFRYDVTLRIDKAINTSDKFLSLNWEQQLTIDAVRQILDSEHRIY
jgi:hypothetical protein